MHDELLTLLKEFGEKAPSQRWVWPPDDSREGFPALLLGVCRRAPILLDHHDPRWALRLRTGSAPLPVWSRQTVAFWTDSTDLWRSFPNRWAMALLTAWWRHIARDHHTPTQAEETLRTPDVHGPCVVTGLVAGQPTSVPPEFRAWLAQQLTTNRTDQSTAPDVPR